MSERSTNRRRLLLRSIIGLVVTGGLLSFLFRYIDLHDVGQLMQQTRWSLWFSGLALWIIIYLVRARRFVRLAPQTPYFLMLSITAVHNFLLRLMPFRTGELAYAFLVKRAGTAGLGESLISLLLLRILDSTLVLVLFAAALAVHQGTFLGNRRLSVLIAIGVAFMGMLMILALPALLRLLLALARTLLRWFRLEDKPACQRAMTKTAQAIDTFDQVQRGAIAEITLISTIQWLLTFVAFFALMRSFVMPVDLAQTTLGSTAAVVTGFLPIGGIGSFGTLEAGWALGFYLVGLPKTQAVASGIGVSLSTFCYNALLGLLGWIGLSMMRQHPPR